MPPRRPRSRPRNRRPTHPGEILREEFLKPLGLTQRALAEHIGEEVKTINRLVNERGRVTIELALNLAEAFNTTPLFWINMQTLVDLWDADKPTCGPIRPAKTPTSSPV